MRRVFIWTAVLLVGVSTVHGQSLRALSTTAAKAPPAQRKITVPAGTRILIRTMDPIGSQTHKSGARFTASLETNLKADNVVVAKSGTTVYGQLVSAKSAGRFKGSSKLVLELTDIVIRGTPYPIITTTVEYKGEGEGKKTTRKVVGGAGLGTLIGGIAGGGSGAAIGAVAGAATGTAVAGSKKGEQLYVPSESLLEFRLEEAVLLPR